MRTPVSVTPYETEIFKTFLNQILKYGYFIIKIYIYEKISNVKVFQKFRFYQFKLTHFEIRIALNNIK